MAIDSLSQSNPTNDSRSSTIENEIPAYRAISARAVSSVVLGLAAVFCFTSLWFLLLTAASVVLGWSALRAIKRFPDILTGSGLAKAGIGLGLAFGLTATTRIVVEDLMLTYEATRFAKNYVEVLKSNPVAEAIWWKQSPAYRNEKTPAETVDELKKTKNPGGENIYESESQTIVKIKERLSGPNQGIHFARIEKKLADGLTQYANALIDVDGPSTKDFPEKEEFVLLELMKEPGGGRDDWKVRELRYPYKPASVGLRTEKKDDDGHGHSH